MESGEWKVERKVEMRLTCTIFALVYKSESEYYTKCYPNLWGRRKGVDPILFRTNTSLHQQKRAVIDQMVRVTKEGKDHESEGRGKDGTVYFIAARAMRNSLD